MNDGRPGKPGVPQAAALYLAVIQFFFLTTWIIYVIFLPTLAESVGIPRSATAWTWRGLRVDGFGYAALVHDPGWASDARLYPGVGTGVESGGPFRTLLSLEWAYGFRSPRQDGGSGTQTMKLTVYKPF